MNVGEAGGRREIILQLAGEGPTLSPNFLNIFYLLFLNVKSVISLGKKDRTEVFHL